MHHDICADNVFLDIPVNRRFAFPVATESTVQRVQVTQCSRILADALVKLRVHLVRPTTDTRFDTGSAIQMVR